MRQVWIRCCCCCCFLLLLLLCSAAGISGGHGLATVDYGSAVGPASTGVFWLGESANISRETSIAKIGVPMKHGFKEFMKVEKDPKDHRQILSGFPVDVFNEVLKASPYEVAYGLSASVVDEDNLEYYNLVSQRFDAVVGDVAVTPNRSDFVDFSYESTKQAGRWRGSLEENSSVTRQYLRIDRRRDSQKEDSGVTTHMKLRIGVPIKNGFHEFIGVYHHPKDIRLIVSGFVVDVFKEVMEALPYKVSWKFIPYETGHEDNTGYYDELIYQLCLKRYDVVVGDITLTAKRLKYGEFSLPYMLSGVAMMVPIEKENDVNSLWWFFKPLSMEMWLITIALFVSKGILIWIFEHKNNEEFQGTPSEQVGKILSFTFSIFVFSQKEKLESNYSRFIINLWTFAVFVIVTIYAANVSLMLSIETPQPTLTNLENLIENGDYVGYQKGSFVFDVLKQWGFQESKLKAYATKEEYATALLQGSDNNGVSAIVDEIPYLRVVLTHYGHRFAMSSLTQTASGFGFVFARGSKIARDVSTVVLKLEEEGIISRIKKRWFDPITTSHYPPQSPGGFKTLGPRNFRGLFLITEAATGATLFLFIICYAYACMKGIIKRQWERVRTMLSRFYNEC